MSTKSDHPNNSNLSCETPSSNLERIASGQDSNDRHWFLFEKAPVAYQSLDSEGCLLEVNPAWLKILGYERNEVIGKSFTRFLTPEYVPVFKENFPRFKEKGELRGIRFESFHKSGKRLTVEGDGTVSYDERGNFRRTHCVIRDITDELASEKALQESQELLAGVVDSVTDHMSMVNEDLDIIWANDTARSMFGPDIIGEKCYWKYHKRKTPCDKCLVLRVFETGETQEHETTVISNTGEEFHFWCTANVGLRHADGRPKTVVEVSRDVTARKRIEDELRRHQDHLEQLVNDRTRKLAVSQEKLTRTERLASMGTLAAGIAHEINNPLGSIMLGLDTGLKSINNHGLLEVILNQGKRDVRRCSEIVKGILRFARQQPSEKWIVDLNNVARDAFDLTKQYGDKHNVSLELCVSNDSNLVLGNPIELEQVVINLIHNAVHACDDNGQVTVNTGRKANSACLTVSDNGCGLSQEQMERVFDPFYTTRSKQGGTGLGLSTTHGIVADHAGTIDIESAPNTGTTFTVTLPREEA